MKTKRRSIAFTEVQMDWLEAKAKTLGLTVAATVRRLVDHERDPNIKRMHELQDVTRKAMLPRLVKDILGG